MEEASTEVFRIGRVGKFVSYSHNKITEAEYKEERGVEFPVSETKIPNSPTLTLVKVTLAVSAVTGGTTGGLVTKGDRKPV